MKEWTGWLIYRKKDAERNQHYIPFYEQAAKKRGATISLRFLESLSFCDGKLFYENEPANLPDFVVMRADVPDLSSALEKQGCPVFNCADFSRVANDKWLTFCRAKEAGIPVPETELATGENAGAIAEKLGYPLVIKPRDGHGGQDVFWVDSEKALQEILKAYAHNSFLLQEPVSDLGKDLRVYAVGGRIVAAMLRSREDDFRSNYCLGGNASCYVLAGEELALVEKVVKTFPSDFAGYDFIFHQGKMVLNEMEDVVGARMLYHLTELDVVDLYVEHILKAIAPAS